MRQQCEVGVADVRFSQFSQVGLQPIGVVDQCLPIDTIDSQIVFEHILNPGRFQSPRAGVQFVHGAAPILAFDEVEAADGDLQYALIELSYGAFVSKPEEL